MDSLKKCGASPSGIITIYCSLIRSVIEYAAVVYGGLPQYLSAVLKNVQGRAVSIIWPGVCYEVAFASAGLPTLAARRDLLSLLCTRFIAGIVPDHPLYPLINGRLIDIPVHYSLRSGRQHRLLHTRTDRLSRFVTTKFKPGKVYCYVYCISV